MSTLLPLMLRRIGPVLLGAFILCLPSMLFAQGIQISAGGPVNRSIGGASVAAPLDSIGANYWNPATISGLDRNELSFGVDILFQRHDFASTVGPFSGSTDADPGTFPAPTVGWVHKFENSRLTFGLLVAAVAGFKTNLPADPSNPILAPAPIGFGRVSSEASFLQIAPSFSYAVTPQLSVAAGPVITTAQVALEPFVFAAPNTNGQFSPGRSSTYHWGGGVQGGVFYEGSNGWNLGASLKSPSWIETFEFFGEDAAGGPRTLEFGLDLPLIASIGVAYQAIPNWLFALDVRYLDYDNADGFGDSATFNPDGSLNGLGWRSVFSFALGAQRILNEKLTVRAGYNFNQSPIPDSAALVNIASPLGYEHTLSCGGSYNLCESIAVNVGYSYVFNNTLTGPVVLPGIGTVPGASVSNTANVNLLSFGVTMRH